MVPPLRGRRSRRANEEKIGYSGRDDGERTGETQEHSPFEFAQGGQEWFCHKRREKRTGASNIWGALFYFGDAGD